MRVIGSVPLFAALAVVALAGCGGDSGPAVEVVREREGVRLTLTLDEEAYEVGEPVEVAVEVENLREVSPTYGYVPSSEPGLQVRVTSELAGDQLLNSDDEPIGEQGFATLGAGDALSTSVRWEQVLALYTTPAQAPEGDYTVTARLIVDSPSGGDQIEVTAAAVAKLRGGDPLLAVATAIQTAVINPDLKAWIAERQATGAICAYQPTELYFSANTIAEQVTPTEGSVYDLAAEAGLPICSPISLGGEWRVQFFAAGPEPTRVSVLMDIKTGENVRFEEGGTDPVPLP